MKNIIFVGLSFCTLLLLYSCRDNKRPNELRNSRFVIDSLQCARDSNTLYFPSNEKLFDTGLIQIDKASNLAYSKMLYFLHEPILYNCADTSEIFRFTWLRTFHNPISIRVLKRNNNFILTLKVSDGQGGYEPGKLIKDTTFFVTSNEWNTFTALIANTNFWNLNTVSNDDGKDGAEWILEGKVKQKYHVVSRWTPTATRDKEVKNCCDYLIRLSGIRIPDKEFY